MFVPFICVQAIMVDRGIAVNQAGGLEVQCVHNQYGALKFDTGQELYSGFLDVVVLPYGSKSIVSQMRAGFKLKYNDADRETFRERESHDRYASIARCLPTSVCREALWIQCLVNKDLNLINDKAKGWAGK